MIRVYVAGRYSADNVMDVARNIREGRSMGAWLQALGYAPFVPWLDWELAVIRDLPKESFLEVGLSFLEACNCILLVPGWESSNGTHAEIARANELGIPVFKTIANLETWAEEREKRDSDGKRFSSWLDSLEESLCVMPELRSEEV